MHKTILLCWLLFLGLTLFSQTRTSGNYTTQKTENPPLIDGIIYEKEWEGAAWKNDFVQFEPNEGKAPSQQTEFKILYDENYIYIAIKAFDTEPEKIVKRMSRRDGNEGDWIRLGLDSYNDKRSAFVFTVSASGVKSDLLMTDDGNNEDETWDPIWFTKTSITSEGWEAEIKIPFDQLRFNANNMGTWGFLIARYVYRSQELSTSALIKHKTNGLVSQFPELYGIENIKPSRQNDIVPYISTRFDKYEKEIGNPYAPGREFIPNAGLDGKIGITNNFTIDYTINPDFGQVEADPSEVNLSAFETFFDEKRPFFIEGKNITNFNLTFGDAHFSRDNLFYSRRIGRRPHYNPDLAHNEYIDAPENTTILGAIKLTGKTDKGLSVGILQSMTSEEMAEIDSEGERRKEVVEPFTNYLVTRVQKDIKKGNTLIGGMFTSTNRNIKTDGLNYLPTNAYTGGVDFTQHFKDKKYYLNINTAISQVEGSTEAITNLQESPQRFYQRPDASHVNYDTTRTTLTGSSGAFHVGRGGSTGLRFIAWYTWRSPGFETNDVGYLNQCDFSNFVGWLGYRTTEPFGIFRTTNYNFNIWKGWDFGRNNLFDGGNINLQFELKNFWWFYTGGSFEYHLLDNYFLWGGPAFKKPPTWSVFNGFDTDEKKMLSFDFTHFMSVFTHDLSTNNYYEIGINLRPANSIAIELNPSYSNVSEKLQYVHIEELEGGNRYIFGNMQRHDFSMTTRLEYYITPDLSVQFYGQPFISSGKFSKLKFITNAKANDINDSFTLIDEQNVTLDTNNDEYILNDNGYNISFDNPDFNFKEFRSNLVVRWEYLPGSILYVVWSSNKNEDSMYGDFSFTRDIKDLNRLHPYNIFMVKLSYRFSI